MLRRDASKELRRHLQWTDFPDCTGTKHESSALKVEFLKCARVVAVSLAAACFGLAGRRAGKAEIPLHKDWFLEGAVNLG